MNVIALKTDLFPDADTVAAGLDAAFSAAVATLDLTRPDMEEADWLGIIDALLAANRIITL